ncbi:hypothetical protein DSM107007_57520 [Nostoc sp. PCC 7120 = FACHB-418]|uniref:hypothetical protein n=1 Tax=Nostoc sp. (strain PCC 7120 / SAG 25.82 / UTEX 2576) TaxID=103690 RepID=UPI000FB8A344|nr:hypothetical protein [Nostoc sp. PCC 7120 = FACHB-418]RUR72384.1 hypothetical protein DSM107007_57520 [Nostoc sp. PCC 7120 = FACHB-418]
MQNLTRIDDPASLIESGVYQIDRTLYRYIEKIGTLKAPQYIFRPLAGEKKKEDIKLNHKALSTRLLCRRRLICKRFCSQSTITAVVIILR